jgi:hypothetical protein
MTPQNEPCSRQDNEHTKLVYIVGCGRSGSTVLGFCLGSMDMALDVGELISFARQKGRPKGFGPETETYKFWLQVKTSLEANPEWPGLKAFQAYERRFDTHWSFPLIYLFSSILMPLGLREYRKALKCLYETVMASSGWSAVIDGSKYPTRLLHLSKIIDASRLRAVYMVRDPANLCVAFRNPDQGKPRSSAYALTYYLVSNLFSKIALSTMAKDSHCRVRYEDLALLPGRELRTIGEKLGLNVEPVVSLIEHGHPLRRGFLMNGNRMRKRPEIVFRTTAPKVESLSGVPSILAACLRFVFFRDTP